MVEQLSVLVIHVSSVRNIPPSLPPSSHHSDATEMVNLHITPIVRSALCSSPPLNRLQSYRSNLVFSTARRRAMASVADSIPHTVRTAKDPRQNDIYDVSLARVDQVNSTIRLLRLALRRDGVCDAYLLLQQTQDHQKGRLDRL